MAGMETYSFGEWLKRRREQLRLTQRALGVTVHCSVAMIKKIEADERDPSPELARLLAIALKIPESNHRLFVEVARGERQVDLLWEIQDETVTASAPAQEPAPLPKAATPFVGRTDELVHIGERLARSDCCLLTLVGPGGVGKTRLALAAAQAHQALFVDGVAFVSLTAITDSASIPDAVAQSLRVPLTGPPAEQVLAYLRRRTMLLVLDNCEQLVGDLTWLFELLAAAPGIKVLATSRELLKLEGEWVFTVPELAEAISLFVITAQRVKRDFDVEGEKPAVARICQLVENLPLAVELAAAWVRVMPCAEIAREIASSLDILTTSLRTVPDKHRSMHAAFEQSWRRLSDGERTVFKGLSVFRGGFTREAAEQVAGASLTILASLIDRSLLRVDANGRYDLHELLRQYANEKLAEAGEVKTAMARYRDYFLAFAENAERELFDADQLDWFGRLEAEHSNLMEAIDWSVGNGDIAASLRLAGSLARFWSLHGYHHEGYKRLKYILSLPEASARTTLRAKALKGAGYIQWFEHNYVEAHLLLKEAVAIAREVGDLRELVQAVRYLGSVLYCLGEYELAASSLEESLALARKMQDIYGVYFSLTYLGDVALKQGNPKRAQWLYQECIDPLKKRHDKTLLTYTLRRLAVVILESNDYAQAKVLCQESLHLNLAIGDRRAVAANLVGFAGIAIAQGHTIYAAKLLGAADTLLKEIAAKFLLPDQFEYERHMEVARNRLAASTFDRAWAEGQTMTMEQVAASVFA
ncbi:MAG TPA: helix-turn-helix domain-containing protein [Aggregatilineales bacterium]|nr:helix-turn-helix domain-containing protein [Aggregatilineales bacterium]